MLPIVVAGLVAGCGHDPISVPRGAECTLDFYEDGVEITINGPGQEGATVATLNYAQVRSLGVRGRGAITTTTGGGWVGGGFGVEGAVEGALMASALNALTTRTKTSVETLVHLNAGSRDIVLLNQSLNPMDLENPALAGVRPP